MPSIQIILDKIKQHQPILLDETNPAAAVMIILLLPSMKKLSDPVDELNIVITKRSATLANYAGHYSFPGGMRDLTDKDLYETAIRETQEELHLMSADYQYIGTLNDFHDRYGHLVRPFVSAMEKKIFLQRYHLSVTEIAEIYFFPWPKLKTIAEAPSLQTITHRRPSYAYKEANVFIWGLTASILVHLASFSDT